MDVVDEEFKRKIMLTIQFSNASILIPFTFLFTNA
jgi:hypothetical protein